MELAERDQGRRAAADAVEQGDHLWHGGHLHGQRRVGADAAADRGAGDDPGQVVSARVPQRDRDDHAHRGGGQLVAAYGGAGGGEPHQAEDEQRRAGQVREVERLAPIHRRVSRPAVA